MKSKEKWSLKVAEVNNFWHEGWNFTATNPDYSETLSDSADSMGAAVEEGMAVIRQFEEYIDHAADKIIARIARYEFQEARKDLAHADLREFCANNFYAWRVVLGEAIENGDTEKVRLLATLVGVPSHAEGDNLRWLRHFKHLLDVLDALPHITAILVKSQTNGWSLLDNKWAFGDN